MLQLGRTYEFDAAHKLPEYSGKCNRLHGHTYKMEVVVQGTVQREGSDQGMIIDFNKLDSLIMESVVNKLDHSYLNDLIDTPTAEYLVGYIAGELLMTCSRNDLRLVKVKLWETPNSYAEWLLNV